MIILPDLMVYTDGASRSNPGHASCAYLVGFAGKDPFKTHKQYLGDTITNNQAEYRGMALALAYLVELISSSPSRSFGSIAIHSDSQLVVEQINGKWKVRDADLKATCEECQANLRTLRERGHQVTLQWIPREKNSRADQLCNQALDQAV
jgi:ribonuclease H / adenosylcobalamin/alpha-ribazole phosphatase